MDSYSSAHYAQGSLKFEQTCECNLKAMCAQEKSTFNWPRLNLCTPLGRILSKWQGSG